MNESESNLVSHARRELQRAGLFDANADYNGMIGEAVVGLVERFAEQGHSGESAMQTLALFDRVARFDALTAITADPEEWMNVSEYGGPDNKPIWQNRRKPSVFSNDGGQTWYDIDAHPTLDEGHADMVASLSKPGATIKEEITPHQLAVWHHATGIGTEVGELLTAAKAYSIYGRPVDRGNVVEELGDLEFYMQGLRMELGITREETLQYNMEKLARRYPGYRYSNVRAVERADKAEA